MLVALSGRIIIIINLSLWGFKGIIQMFEATAIGTGVCGICDITQEHCSFIDWSFLAYKAVIHDGAFVRGWNGALIQQNCLFANWQAPYC